jgi:putative hydrolase of the HAD superfamily
VGVGKPDPKIFRAALDALQVSPLEVVHVGDSMTGDVEGAKAAGIAPILLDRGNRYQPAEGLLRIEALLDLKRIVVPDL